MMYNDITPYILTVIVELLAACVNHSSEKYYIITYAGSLSIVNFRELLHHNMCGISIVTPFCELHRRLSVSLFYAQTQTTPCMCVVYREDICRQTTY